MINSELLLKKREQIKSVFQETQVKTLKSLVSPNKKILEIGCGYGFFLKSTVEHSKLTIGIDKFLNIAPSILKNKNLKFIKADGENLPFKNNIFDIVYSMDVIEHIENDYEFIKESLRVLKKNGYLIIGTPNKDRLSAQIKKLLLKPNRYPLIIKDKIFNTVIHIREYKKIELINLLDRFNIEIKTIIPVYLGLTDLLPFGLKITPRFLEKLCQFWLLKIKKF